MSEISWKNKNSQEGTLTFKNRLLSYQLLIHIFVSGQSVNEYKCDNGVLASL